MSWRRLKVELAWFTDAFYAKRTGDNSMPQQKPSIGRIVHYTDYNGECRAAIITDVQPESNENNVLRPESVSLTVFHGATFGTNGVESALAVRFDPDHNPMRINGSWHWPERVD